MNQTSIALTIILAIAGGFIAGAIGHQAFDKESGDDSSSALIKRMDDQSTAMQAEIDRLKEDRKKDAFETSISELKSTVSGLENDIYELERETYAQRTVGRLDNQLNLDVDQRGKIRIILKQMIADQRVIQNRYKENPRKDAVWAGQEKGWGLDSREVAKKAMESIKKELTPSQLATFQKLDEDRKIRPDVHGAPR
ncbi:MAG: hypothetical protein ACYTDT_00775 [Planctomycetota bacterium]|jgi:outer membrane murein-binding lipoprotein Lpp